MHRIENIFVHYINFKRLSFAELSHLIFKFSKTDIHFRNLFQTFVVQIFTPHLSAIFWLASLSSP